MGVSAEWDEQVLTDGRVLRNFIVKWKTAVDVMLFYKMERQNRGVRMLVVWHVAVCDRHFVWHTAVM